MMRDEILDEGVNDPVNSLDNTANPDDDLVNDLVNGPVKNKILGLIKSNPNINYDELATKIGVSASTIKRHIQKLKADGIVERFGSDKTGEYRIKS